jgi:hypothetical protein
VIAGSIENADGYSGWPLANRHFLTLDDPDAATGFLNSQPLGTYPFDIDPRGNEISGADIGTQTTSNTASSQPSHPDNGVRRVEHKYTHTSVRVLRAPHPVLLPWPRRAARHESAQADVPKAPARASSPRTSARLEAPSGRSSASPSLKAST